MFYLEWSVSVKRFLLGTLPLSRLIRSFCKVSKLLSVKFIALPYFLERICSLHRHHVTDNWKSDLKKSVSWAFDYCSERTFFILLESSENAHSPFNTRIPLNKSKFSYWLLYYFIIVLLYKLVLFTVNGNEDLIIIKSLIIAPTDSCGQWSKIKKYQAQLC